jgi:hypothetical protein
MILSRGDSLSISCMKSLSLTVGFGLIKDALRSPVNTMLQESYFATISESSRFIIKPYINACQNEEQTINFKLNWKKCDVQNYQKLVTDQITDMDLLSIIDCIMDCPYFSEFHFPSISNDFFCLTYIMILFLESMDLTSWTDFLTFLNTYLHCFTDMDLLSIIDCEEKISKLIEILNNNADKCSKKLKSRSKRSKPWTPEIKSLCKLNKRSHWKWRESGTVTSF